MVIVPGVSDLRLCMRPSVPGRGKLFGRRVALGGTLPWGHWDLTGSEEILLAREEAEETGCLWREDECWMGAGHGGLWYKLGSE